MLKESNVFSFHDLDWQRIEPDLTKGVTGILLIPDGKKGAEAVLTKIKPGGEQRLRQDDSDHIFYFLKGYGELRINDSLFFVKSKTVAEIPSGTPHGYKNTSDEDMILIKVVIPAG